MKQPILKITVAFISILMIGFPTLSQEKRLDNPAQFKEGFVKTASNTSTIQADFIQEKHSSYFQQPLISKGKFAYDQSGKMRWEQTIPESYIMLITGNTLKIKKNGKEETHDLSTNKYLTYLKLLMVGTVNGDLLNSTQFTYTYYKNGSNYEVELVPINKKMKSMFSGIRLKFSASFRLESMQMKESSGDYTLIKFVNTEFNKVISSSKFTTF